MTVLRSCRWGLAALRLMMALLAASTVQGACAEAPTLSFESSSWDDVDGLHVRQVGVQLEQSLSSSWRVIGKWEQVRSMAEPGNNQGEAVALGVASNDDAPGLRSAELRLNSYSRHAFDAALAVGVGAWTLSWQREALVAQRDLMQRRLRVQFQRDVVGLPVSAQCLRSQVSDGNLLRYCEIEVAAPEPETLGWHLHPRFLAQRRVARFWSPYYWSPEQAETNAGPSVGLLWRGPQASARFDVARLVPLNGASSPLLRQSIEATLPGPAALRWTVRVMRLRSLRGENAYRALSFGLSVEAATW